jgi:hypothetical protein
MHFAQFAATDANPREQKRDRDCLHGLGFVPIWQDSQAEALESVIT